MRVLSFIFFLLLSFDVFAILRLDISILHKAGIDKGLILVNELHSSEDVVPNQKIKLNMKNNYSVEFYAYFAPDAEVYGPAAMVAIMGRVLGSEEEELASFYNTPIFVRLGEVASFEHQNQDRGLHIEITIRPSMYLR